MKKKIGKKNFWLLYHIGLIIFSAIVAAIMKYSQTGDAFHPTVIPAFVSLMLMCGGIGYLAIFMVNKATNYNQEALQKRIIPALIVFYIASYLIVSVSISISSFIWFLHLGRDLSEFIPHLFKYELSFASGRLFIWLLFFTVAFFYGLWNKSVKKEQKLKEENLVHDKKYQLFEC